MSRADKARRRRERDDAADAAREALDATRREWERAFRARHANLIASLEFIGIDESELRAYVEEVIQHA